MTAGDGGVTAGDGGVTAGAGFDLDDKFRATHGRILLTGVQALARVLFDQVRADRSRGLRTGAFVSGYQGSPLGTFDLTLQRTGPMLVEHDVVLVPGVNEDIAATSVWGSRAGRDRPARAPRRRDRDVVRQGARCRPQR